MKGLVYKILPLLMLAVSCSAGMDPYEEGPGVEETRAFIRESWEKSIRYLPDDFGTHIGMPLPLHHHIHPTIRAAIPRRV